MLALTTRRPGDLGTIWTTQRRARDERTGTTGVDDGPALGQIEPPPQSSSRRSEHARARCPALHVDASDLLAHARGGDVRHTHTVSGGTPGERAHRSARSVPGDGDVQPDAVADRHGNALGGPALERPADGSVSDLAEAWKIVVKGRPPHVPDRRFASPRGASGGPVQIGCGGCAHGGFSRSCRPRVRSSRELGDGGDRRGRR